MNAAHAPANSALFDDQRHVSVSRALDELQARRLRLNAPGGVLFTLPVTLTTSGCRNLWSCAAQTLWSRSRRNSGQAR